MGWLWNFIFEAGDKYERDTLRRCLAHHLLVLDARFGGLNESGMLDSSIKTVTHTADDGTDWIPGQEGVPTVQFKIVKEKTSHANWALSARLPLNETEDSPATEWLFIYTWKADGGGEDERSITHNQSLRIHQESAEQCMKRMLDALELPDEFDKALCLAARIHDEGKDCERWQDGFNAPRDEPIPSASPSNAGSAFR